MIEEDELDDERYSVRGVSSKLENRTSPPTEDNLGGSLYRKIPSLKKAGVGGSVVLKHTMTN